MSRRGEVALAMLQAAWPPARVTHVCERAQVCNTNEYIWIYMCMYAGVCLVNHMKNAARCMVNS